MAAFLYLFIACVFIMLASLAGLITVWTKLGKWMHKNLSFLVSFSSGVFLVVAFNLALESFEFSNSVTVGFFAILLGILFLHFVSYLFPEAHYHHEKHSTEYIHNKLGAKRILVGDAIHNVGDGILLAPAFAIDIRLGIVTAVGILIHEFVQEISEFFVLREAGYSTNQALQRNFLISSTILVGAVLGYFLSSVHLFVGPLLGIAAGSFFYVVIEDLIPKSVAFSQKRKAYKKYFFVAMLGMAIMWMLSQFMH